MCIGFPFRQRGKSWFQKANETSFLTIQVEPEWCGRDDHRGGDDQWVVGSVKPSIEESLCTCC